MQPTHMMVPLKNLRPGHEAPNHPGNARVTGREDGIAELAAHIHARGKIDDLLIYDDGVPETYFVANGNRSLQALRMIYGEGSEEPVSCKLTTADRAFEDSFAVAVTAKKFHPVDDYEAYAKLRDIYGRSEEEIARQYGMTLREVQQALALGGSLSPHVRDLWRQGQIDTEVVHALPMVGDHDAQDKLLKKLSPEGRYDRLSAWHIKNELKIDKAGRLVEFVGADNYVRAGGKVTLDLFGVDHKVSNPKLAKKLADAKLQDECAELVAVGWSWALPYEAVGNPRESHSCLNVTAAPASAQEKLELEQLDSVIPQDQWGEQIALGEMTGKQRAATLRKREIEQALEERAFTPEMKAKSGCFVSIDDDGLLEISFGWAKNEEKAAAKRAAKQASPAVDTVGADEAGQTSKPALGPAAISNALRERLEAALIDATKDALLSAVDTEILKSPLSQLLARLVSSQINVNGISVQIYSHGIKDKLPAIREALPAELVNAAIAKRFDAEDYFKNAPKKFVTKAIAEVVNADEARKAGALGKADLVKFAMTNVAKAGWLPKELRTVHYVAPAAKKEATKPKAPAKPAAKPKAPAVKKSAKKPAKKK
ncbi:ParB family chromosome partitioning protein [Bradyrhizobium ottawaense]|uniref:ParB/RepB/Spo0J family partition protein n=1 Tax=Bradyrhizobium ottawaense TaxID=931866 RepID=UPI003512A4F9